MTLDHGSSGFRPLCSCCCRPAVLGRYPRGAGWRKPSPSRTRARSSSTASSTSRSGGRRRRSTSSCSASRPRAPRPRRPPTRASPSTTHALYVAVRAYDTEPIADRRACSRGAISARPPTGSRSSSIRISIADRRTSSPSIPVGVKADRYYFNDGDSDDSWDAVWDVEVARDADGWTAEFRIPFSQLRFRNNDGGPVGFAVIREVGRLAETSTWPLLSRNANGFVSQFAEVRGLRMGGSPKRLELLPYTLGSLSLQPPSDNPLIERTDPGRLDRPRPEVRAAARADADGDRQSRLRPGRSRSGRRQPRRVRDVLPGAAAVLRRRARARSSSTSTATTGSAPGCSTRAASAARRRARPTLDDDEYSERPDVGDDHRRGEADRARRRVLGRRAERGDARGRGDDRRPGSLRRDQAVEPLTGYTVVRARREFANQSNIGLMLTSTNRQLTDDGQLPRRATPTPAAWTTTCASAGASTSRASGPAAASRGRPRRSPGCRRTPSTPSSVLTPTTSTVDADATSLSGHAGSFAFGKIAGEKTRFSGNYGYKSPGFDINDLGFQRRADERNVSHWFQMRDNVPGRFTRSFIWNLNQWAGWNFGGDRTVQRRQRQHALDVEELLGERLRRECQRRAAARPRHARRAGGARQPERAASGTTSASTTAGACRPATTAITRATARARRATTSARNVTWRPDERVVGQDRVPLQHQQRRRAVGDERGGRRAADPLRVRPAEAAHRRVQRSASTTR